MRNALKTLMPALLAGLTLGGCAKAGGPAAPQTQEANQSGSAPAASAPARPNPPPSSAPGAASLTASGFDVNRVPVVNPELGEFPYVGLIDGYSPGKSKHGKNVPFDRYEFFDGTKLIPVEGRLVTVGAEGAGAAPHEIFKTYETLVTRLGGVKVYEGVDPRHTKPRLPEYGDRRHRHGFTADRAGVYVLRTPESEIWVEAYASPDGASREGYFLTVVEKQSLVVRASMLPAEEMKRELDAEGHVALYINFDFNKAEIRPESRPLIDEVVKLLRGNPGLSLTVEGHTDNVGAPDYNRRLSESRATAVVAALTARGVDARRLKPEGLGQERPIADNGTDEGRARNRRVELVK